MKTLFADWLRRRRLLLRLSRKELAQQVAISSVTLQDYELGRRRPSDATLTALAQLLRIPPSLHDAFFLLAKGGQPDATLLQLMEQVSPAAPLVSSQLKPRPGFLGPGPVDTLVGRQPNVEQVVGMLQYPEIRLITLAGPPGVGKTRLALAVALHMNSHDTQPLQIVFASLASAVGQGHDGILDAVAHALSIPADDKQAAAMQILARLSREPSLLILDNFETVMPAVQCVADMLKQSVQVKILVTSREVLRLYGEHVQHVAPLPCPPRDNAGDGAADDPASLSLPILLDRYPSIALFVQRAQAVAPSFVLSDDNRADVIRVCQMVDGLPLGIEIAASQLAQWPLSALITQLGQNLLRLQPTYRDAIQRHWSLHNAIDLSYASLDEATQQIFNVLSTFTGGADAEAIATLARDTRGHETETAFPVEEVEESLQILLARSLIQSESTNTETRYTLLETLREYGRERLEAQGQLHTLLRSHAAYFVEFARAKTRQLVSKTYRWAIGQLALNHDNCRAALHWCLQHDTELGLALAGQWAEFWTSHGHFVEGNDWLRRLLGIPDFATVKAGSLPVPVTTPAQAHGVCALILFAMNNRLNDDYALGLLKNALHYFHQHGDKLGVALAHHRLGYVYDCMTMMTQAAEAIREALPVFQQYDQQEYVARALISLTRTMLGSDPAQELRLIEEALTICRELDKPTLVALCLTAISETHKNMGNYAHAAELANEAAAIYRTIGDLYGLHRTLTRLGYALFALNRFAECRVVIDEYVRTGQQLGLTEIRTMPSAHHLLGLVAYGEGNWYEAMHHLITSIEYRMRNNELHEIAFNLAALTPVIACQGDHVFAARLGSAIHAHFEAHHLWQAFTQQADLLRHGLALAQQALDDEAFEAAQQEGQTWPLQRALDEAGRWVRDAEAKNVAEQLIQEGVSSFG